MDKKKDASFEENLIKLETIVKELESGEVLLDDAIKKFTEALELAKSCDEKLKQAEESIQKIVNDDGTITDFKTEE